MRLRSSHRTVQPSLGNPGALNLLARHPSRRPSWRRRLEAAVAGEIERQPIALVDVTVGQYLFFTESISNASMPGRVGRRGQRTSPSSGNPSPTAVPLPGLHHLFERRLHDLRINAVAGQHAQGPDE